MASYDNSVLSQFASLSDGTTSAFTIASGAIALALIADGGQGTLNGVTIAGQAGTLQGTRTQGSRTVRIYSTLTPTSGSQTISYDGDAAYGDNGLIVVVGLSITGADSFADFASNVGTSGDPTVTVPNAASGDLIVDICYHGNLGAAGASQTQRQANAANQIKVSTQDGVDGGVMSWTNNEALNWASAGIRAVNTSAAGQPTIRRWQGVPFMRLGGTVFGNGWTH